jgi:hypothetical protein
MSGGTAAVSLAITAVSAAVSMYAQHQGQKAQEKSARAAAEYNAQVAENEAAAQQQLARNEMSKGIADRERQQRQAARAMGQMRADIGASGFEMDSGSMVSLLAEEAREHQYDSQVIMNNAAQAAWGHQVGETSALNQKGFADYQYANADAGKAATGLAMAGTLLGGIGKGIGQYNAWAKTSPGASTGTSLNANKIGKIKNV